MQMTVFRQPMPCIGTFFHITNWTPKLVYTLVRLQTLSIKGKITER